MLVNCFILYFPNFPHQPYKLFTVLLLNPPSAAGAEYCKEQKNKTQAIILLASQSTKSSLIRT